MLVYSASSRRPPNVHSRNLHFPPWLFLTTFGNCFFNPSFPSFTIYHLPSFDCSTLWSDWSLVLWIGPISDFSVFCSIVLISHLIILLCPAFFWLIFFYDRSSLISLLCTDWSGILFRLIFVLHAFYFIFLIRLLVHSITLLSHYLFWT